MKRADVYKLIDGERDYQDEKWNTNTTMSGGHHYTPKAMANLCKVTALGIAAIEHIDTLPR